MSIMPPDPDRKTSHPPEPCACGCDETDHGDVTGCVHCRRCWEYVPRSTYVPTEGDQDEPDCGRHSWAGLMALLDEHWPDDIFPTRYEDDPKRDAGPRIVSLMRWVNELQVKIQRVESLAADYDDGSEWGAVERPGYVVRERILQALAGDA